ncbi:hypothetical protein SLEP1_g39442 [Rubroshorea leprosula]|uniref:Uncharacterized protein n=1 Tax=Rubroshorea leprosula TaxID=152421 RepID=A0AAV5L075_9ROSI|nr:hypothetical protein SLEP1_g39442 [Rubroshorea leprosula]
MRITAKEVLPLGSKTSSEDDDKSYAPTRHATLRLSLSMEFGTAKSPFNLFVTAFSFDKFWELD